MSTSIMVYLDVNAEMDAVIEGEVNEALESLTVGDKCTMHDLLSKTFLECFEGLPTTIGRRLSYSVSKKVFPLKFIGYTTDRHNEYIVLPK